jgi:hypothetical protein
MDSEKANRKIYKVITCGEDTMVSKLGKRAGINVGTVLSSKSAERRTKHFIAPWTRIKKIIRKNIKWPSI